MTMAVQVSNGGEGGELSRRRAYLAQLRRVLPPSEPWEAWLAESGELPPDFAALPSRPGLPDPLLREVDGRPQVVNSPEAWRERRMELQALLQQWVLGRMPPPPGNVQATVLGERVGEGATAREVQLTFGPGPRARLWLELLIPHGAGPFPVFLTQRNHYAWALIALRRGYLACVYAACDAHDDTDTFLEAYPGYDWSRLTRRAWAASRCVDYLETVPEADGEHIALTGHSRNGKQSLIASAFDERIAAVISSSSGAGGSMPARCCSEPHFCEGIELITRDFPDWFHPRWRFFVGREDRLPVDLHELVALSAPRPCLLSTALNDAEESSWAAQQTYLAVQRVYRLLGAEERLRILWRPGGHETWPAIIEAYVDWCDGQFGRGGRELAERMIHPGGAGRMPALPAARQEPRPPTDEAGRMPALPTPAEVRARVAWMLGEAPPEEANPGYPYGEERRHIAALLGRDSAGEGIEKRQTVFGEYINGDVYLPEGLEGSGRRAPAVLWLHPFSFPQGYVAAYHRGEQVFRTLAAAGLVVLCFDQIGCGRRIEEVEGFYRRHPRWSLLGKMVRDSRAALAALVSLPYVDPARTWALGYGLGALVGLHLGALDEGLAGLITVCGPQPFRLDREASTTGGLGRWAHQHALLPRLGLYVGREEEVPYDVGDLLACLAPRPALVISPQLDREATVEGVTEAVEAARAAYALYGARDRLQQLSPEDYAQLGPEMQARIVEYLRGQLSLERAQ